MTKEQKYRAQMQALGIYEEIFEPELQTLCRLERELTRAQKAWSATAAEGEAPSFLDDHFPIIQKLRAEILQHREAMGLTPKSLRKLTGAGGPDAPVQKDLITAKLDAIVSKVAGYDSAVADPFADIPGAEKAAAISDQMDSQDHYDLKAAVAEDMG